VLILIFNKKRGSYKVLVSLIVALTINFLLSFVVYADSSGPNNLSIAVDDADIGTESWNDPENVTASDDLKAAVDVNDFEISHYIKATDFGFSIPSDAIIEGVVVEIERRVSSNVSGSIVKDASVKLVKEGVIAGEERATGTSYTNKDINESHGSSTDLWGLVLSPADINDEDFGAAVAVTKSNSNGTDREARIDNIRITIHYNIPEEANATITLIKQVVNDNGGEAEAGDFDLKIDGVVAEQGVPIEITANESHTIDEDGIDGYEFTNITGDEKCPANLGENFNLSEDENITCIIANDDADAEGGNEIHGTKFNDLNGNGVKDFGEHGLEGWAIYIDANNNGINDTGELTAVTDSNGLYSFSGLADGTYNVREILQIGWNQTHPSSGKHIVEVDGIATGVDFGNIAPRDIKNIALNEIIELRNNATTEHDKRRLDFVIKSLNKSLEPKYWNDSLHMSTERGEEAFKKERKAVKELQNTIKSKKSLLPDARLQEFINRILNVDRNLALIAIKDAEEEGGSENFIKKAKGNIELGDEAASEGRFRGAVNHYLQAWEFAVKAMESIR